MRKILVTDSLFIFPEHMDMLTKAGFTPVRLDKVKATESELIEAIKDCEGYILGGIEQVTPPVILAAKKLKAICFTGADYAAFIPAHTLATEQGIAITNCPGANATAVAEYTLANILMMLRRIPMFTLQGGKDFYIAPEFQDTTVGIIGYGKIGQRLAFLLKSLGFKVIIYTRSGPIKPTADGFSFASLPDLITKSNVVTLHVDKKNGQDLLDEKLVSSMPTGTIIINTCDESLIHTETLKKRIKDGELFLATDHCHVMDAAEAPVGHVVATRVSTAYNTARANKLASDMATTSIINILTGKDDAYIVNAGYKKSLSA